MIYKNKVFFAKSFGLKIPVTSNFPLCSGYSGSSHEGIFFSLSSREKKEKGQYFEDSASAFAASPFVDSRKHQKDHWISTILSHELAKRGSEV